MNAQKVQLSLPNDGGNLRCWVLHEKPLKENQKLSLAAFMPEIVWTIREVIEWCSIDDGSCRKAYEIKVLED